MRGKVEFPQVSRIICRITPAYAGKSCGNRGINCNICGSPPPMRGKGVTDEEIRHTHGITPAYAGKSSVFPRSSVIFEDHPRLCGEKLLPQSSIPAAAGSPPPMRGKDFFVVQPCTADGITPAYAGKRTPQNPKNPVRRDHPRLCGEKL